MTYTSMGSSSLSCIGSEQPTSPRVRRQYSSSSMTSSSTSYTHSRGSPSKSTYGSDLPELQEDDDRLGALPASASRMSMSGNQDRTQALPLKARSSLGSIRSSTKRTASVKRGPRISTSSIAEAHYNNVLREDFISSYHAPAPPPPAAPAPVQAQPTRKKSGLKSMFSFAPFSRRSAQGVHDAQQQEEVQEAGRNSPNTAVNRWMSTVDKQSDRSSSLESGSRSSGSLLRSPPNARKTTNSVISGKSNRDSLATSSRASSQTNMSARQQRRTPSPMLPSPSSSPMLEQLPIPPPHITIDRSSSPSPSHWTRRTSYSSTHDDVVICDAAATSFFAAGRPKSVYEHRISALAAEHVASQATTASNTINHKPVAVSIKRPRPQVLQLAHKPSLNSQRSDSPGSASSSTPSLSRSRGTPQSMTPPSSPGTPDTSFADMSSPFHLPTTEETKPKRSSFRSWMDVTSEHSLLRRAMPIPPRSSSMNHTQKEAPASRPASGSLSPFIATALRPGSSTPALSVRTNSPTSPNPYTTHTSAPFPTPISSTSPTSPYASTTTQHFSHPSTSSSTSSSSASNNSSISAGNMSYFTLPPSSSAHPDLYPDLKGKTVVGMQLTEEESRLIARMREKRREMRREELGRLRVALGVDA